MSDTMIGGVPGLAVRLGRALEDWGRRAAHREHSATDDGCRDETARLRHEARRATAAREARWARGLGGGRP